MDNHGFVKLAKTLQGRNKEQAESNGMTIEFATLTADYNLKPDTMPDIVIPPGDYYAIDDVGLFKSQYKMQRRVVIAWFGNEPIILGEYKTGTEMIKSG